MVSSTQIKLLPISEVVERFVSIYELPAEKKKEREDLGKIIRRCVNSYAEGYKLSSLASLVSNAAFSALNKSDWKIAKNALKSKAMLLIVNHFRRLDGDMTRLELQADALSEFVLRYLITGQSVLMGGSFQWIPQDEWLKSGINDITMDELIERAIHGNGFHLPEPHKEDLIQLIKLEHSDLKKDVAEMAELLQSNGEALRWMNNLSNSNPQAYSILISAKRDTDEVKAYLQKTHYVESLKEEYYTGKIEWLSRFLRDVREKKKEFLEVKQQVNRVITGKI